MKLYYEPNTGEIWYAVYAKDLFSFFHTTNIPLSTFDIDEITPDNQSICQDIFRTQWKFNELRQRKYYIQAGEVYSRDGWKEYRII